MQSETFNFDKRVRGLSPEGAAMLRTGAEASARAMRKRGLEAEAAVMESFAAALHQYTQHVCTVEGRPMPEEPIAPDAGPTAVHPDDRLVMELPGFGIHDSVIAANLAEGVAQRTAENHPSVAEFYGSLRDTMTRRAQRLYSEAAEVPCEQKAKMLN